MRDLPAMPGAEAPPERSRRQVVEEPQPANAHDRAQRVAEALRRGSMRAWEESAGELAGWMDRLAARLERPVTLLVAGPPGAGKTSLVQGIVGASAGDIALPRAVSGATPVPMLVRSGASAALIVERRDGGREARPVAALRLLADKRQASGLSPAPRLHDVDPGAEVAGLEVYVPSAALTSFEMVDLPGWQGDADGPCPETPWVSEADGLIWCDFALHGLEEGAEALRRLPSRLVDGALVVLSRADLLTPGEAAAVGEAARRRLGVDGGPWRSERDDAGLAMRGGRVVVANLSADETFEPHSGATRLAIEAHAEAVAERRVVEVAVEAVARLQAAASAAGDGACAWQGPVREMLAVWRTAKRRLLKAFDELGARPDGGDRMALPLTVFARQLAGHFDAARSGLDSEQLASVEAELGRLRSAIAASERVLMQAAVASEDPAAELERLDASVQACAAELLAKSGEFRSPLGGALRRTAVDVACAAGLDLDDL